MTTTRQQQKAIAQAKAVAAYEAKCAAMDAERVRIAARVNVTARQVMQEQIAELDSDPAQFNNYKRVELVRQLRELDGVT
jgi:hypothetical protein